MQFWFEACKSTGLAEGYRRLLMSNRYDDEVSAEAVEIQSWLVPVQRRVLQDALCECGSGDMLISTRAWHAIAYLS